MALLELSDAGLWCPAGAFHIDPWKPVPRAVITHGHSDHARAGSDAYLCSPTSKPILALRLGAHHAIEALPFGEATTINGVRVSLHPAGHLLGSAQVRVEHRGEVAVVTGDYKREPDPTAEPFEPVRCDLLVTECTFGLPVYRWRPQQEVFGEINAWWRANATQGKTSLLFGYALGKAQRLLAGVDPSIGPILVHGAVARLVEVYREAGIALPEVLPASVENAKAHKGRALVVAPPSAAGSTWARKFAPSSSAFASGWMAVRGVRRRRALDRGFVLSDHVDWPGLLQTIEESDASRVWATHGFTGPLVRYLRERGLDAHEIQTRFVGDAAEEEPAASEEAEA